MSKRAFKSQASSSKVPTSGFGSTSTFGSGGFGGGFGAAPASSLSYVYEPPDLSRITDSTIQRAFKSLQKKDSTTKAKALEDLQTHLSHLQKQEVTVEDAILEAWVLLYARISIDNSRRVRQLAHGLQGQLATACGKRIAKHMPVVVGAWLCGLQDNDKAVAKAVQESFSKVFPTPEKQNGVWQTFQNSILEYCRDAILKETAQTLSDERITSQDDAEAKYARVVGTSLLTVAQGLVSLPETSIQKEVGVYEEILQAKGVWKLSSYQDSFVRRAVFRLLTAALTKLPKSLDYSVVSNNVIQEGLHSSQSSSSNEYVKTLLQLTREHPEVWNESYSGTGKKSAAKRLSSFFRKGSQGAPVEFWQNLTSLIHDLPIGALINQDTDAKDDKYIMTLISLREGVSRKEELRPTQNEAWKAYLQLAARILSFEDTDEDIRTLVCKEHVLPLLSQYIRPVPEASSWTITGNPQEVCTLSMMVSLRDSANSVESSLAETSAALIQDIQLSLPEQSKDFEKSQENVISQVTRWYSLLSNLNNTSGKLSERLSKIVTDEIHSSMSILKGRNGKPYSAAALIDIALRTTSELTMASAEVVPELAAFAKNDVSQLMASPSAPYLFRILETLRSTEGIGNIYDQSLQGLVNSPQSSSRSRALHTLLSSQWPEDQKASDSLSAIVKEALSESLTGNDDAWSLTSQAIKNKSAPSSLTDDILSSLTESLTIEDQAERGLDGIESLMQTNRGALRGYVSSSKGTPLLSKLLYLSQSDELDEEIRDQATKLKSNMDSLVTNSSDSSTATESMIGLIKNGPLDTSATALSTDSLIGQARRIIDSNPDNTERLLPDEAELDATLQPYFDQGVDTSLALTNPLGGAVYLVSSNESSSWTPQYDRSGMSPAVRAASYLIGVLTTETAKRLEPERRIGIFQFLTVYGEYALDHLLLQNKDPLWRLVNDEADKERLKNIRDQQQAITHLLKSADPGATLAKLLSDSEDDSVKAYYNARAYVALATSSATTFDEEDRLAGIRRSSRIIADTAVLGVVENSRASLKLLNELVSDLAGKPLEDDTDSALRKLVLLNRLIASYHDNLEDVPQQRLVFFVKHVTSSLKSNIDDDPTVSETLKVLSSLLPAIKELYGDFWQDLIQFVTHTLSTSNNVPLLYHGLVLSGVLYSLAKESANDDVEESWNENKQEFGDAMIAVLDKCCHAQDMFNDPRKMVNRLLGQQLPEAVATASSIDLFKPLSSPSPSLQQAAYGLLHQTIPASQEKLVIEAALSQDHVATLPQELLSLVAEDPDIGSHLALRNLSELPASLTGYLLSWKLIFDHWTKASFKMQSDYVSQVKESGSLDKFLSFATEILIYRNGSKSTVNPSKFDLLNYKPNVEPPEQDAEWLLSHVYYLALAHLPTLVKNWWRSSCPRYLERQMEEWTEKYISPSVIAAELGTVSEWDPNPDDTELEIKISPRAREVTASYPVDESHMSIRILIPQSYPLSPIAVTTGQRLGVDEKKWAAWISTCNITINFNSSSQGLGCVVDGLVTWRRNVVGRLKGQSECAICYSVVSGDKQLPTKKCGTCKNMFHGSCLFRWFKSSSSSSCPLCRNAFNYDEKKH